MSKFPVMFELWVSYIWTQGERMNVPMAFAARGVVLIEVILTRLSKCDTSQHPKRRDPQPTAEK